MRRKSSTSGAKFEDGGDNQNKWNLSSKKDTFTLSNGWTDNRNQGCGCLGTARDKQHDFQRRCCRKYCENLLYKCSFDKPWHVKSWACVYCTPGYAIMLPTRYVIRFVLSKSHRNKCTVSNAGLKHKLHIYKLLSTY